MHLSIGFYNDICAVHYVARSDRASRVMYLHYFRDGSLRFCNLYFIQIEIKASLDARPPHMEIFTLTTKRTHNET